MSEKKKILFLYNELSGYFLTCIEQMAYSDDVEIHLVRWPTNKEAPFDFKPASNIRIYERKKFDLNGLLELSESISPNVVFCSGWVDKTYLDVCKNYDLSIPVILAFDNQWENTLRQRFAQLVAPMRFRNMFTHAWVPGVQHIEYAKRLGFDKDHILTGLYSADFAAFHGEFKRWRPEKRMYFPKRFLYAGRQTRLKGFKDLVKAFKLLQKKYNTDWELWVMGAGGRNREAMRTPGIKNVGFIQQGEMDEIIRKTGVLIMPSHFDHWGVSLHEFAAAGFPVLCSDVIGANEVFLREGINGFSFPPKDIKAMAVAMYTITEMSTIELSAMGDESARLASMITPETWADTLMTLL